MIRRHTAVLHVALMASDALSAVLLCVVVMGLRFSPLDPNARWNVNGMSPFEFAIAYGGLWVASLWLLGLYRLRSRWSVGAEVGDVLRATFVAALAIFSLLYLLQLQNVSRLLVLFLLLIQPILTAASRLTLRLSFSRIRSRGYNSRQMLVVGSGAQAQEFAANVERDAALGMQVMGYLRGPSDRPSPSARPVIGTVDQLVDVLHTHVVDEIAICLSQDDLSYVELIVRLCEEEGKIVRVSMRSLGGALVGGRYEQLGEMPLITFLSGPDRVLGLVIKRMTDVVFSALGLLLFSPVMAAIAIYIRVTDGSPVLFGQPRVGLNGRVFWCLKFRTMVPDAEERFPEIAHLSDVHGPAFKMTDDPRITKTGRWLRRTSLDELPQLINVLRGEMSIVGPRPALMREVADYTLWHRRRLTMKPGITGLWQVEARRDNDFDTRVSLDLRYIERWSILMDLKIMVRTVPAMFQQQGR